MTRNRPPFPRLAVRTLPPPRPDALPLGTVGRRALLTAASSLAALLILPAGLRTGRAETATGSALHPFVDQIAPGVFAHRGEVAVATRENAGDHANMGFIVGREAVAVIDTGGSAKVGAQLHEAVRAVTDRPIRYVINTHMHPDHVLGNAAFEVEGTTFVGHHKIARGLAARAERYLAVYEQDLGPDAFAGTKIVIPSQLIDAPTTLDLGGREIVLTPHPTAHTDNDLTVRDSQTGTVFLGDLVFAEHIPTIDGSILGWMAVLDALAAEPAERVVPGHGPSSMGWPDAARPIRHYLQVITGEIRKMIADNRTLSEATQSVGLSERRAWELFDAYHGRNVSAAFAELEWE
ncbi:quinoprotein relay system zinc metallohydrolase 2 [Hyphomicrobium nitrativorans]|uniref:quinoprotein relay system zinc metallohydrolase 2 n=1 Tax=Hyphomicrobium nitrativorans TaxID=1427356 RepID=UPI000A88238A|nr:quinoprotein relay system zinc metallohydrolase 2 [Hyphomicrobium nitrativorans]